MSLLYLQSKLSEIRMAGTSAKFQSHTGTLGKEQNGNQVADGFTKSLSKDKHHSFIRQLNLLTLQEFTHHNYDVPRYVPLIAH